MQSTASVNSLTVISGILLRWILGIAFFASGALKLVPAEYLENDILSSGFGNEWTVPFQARLIISSELIAGVLLMAGLYRRKVLLFSLFMLIFYSVYLFYMMALQGNEGNCGCMGHRLAMTPLQGILKNVVMIVLAIYLLRLNFSHEHKRRHKVLLVILLLVGIVSPYVIYKVDLPVYVEINGSMQRELDLDLLYEGTRSDPPSFELRKDKVILLFASLSCEHCRIAANKLEIIKRAEPDLPIYLVLNGNLELLPDFISESGLRDLPYHICNDGETLVKLAGLRYPRIYLVNNSMVEDELQYTSLNKANLLNWYEVH